MKSRAVCRKHCPFFIVQEIIKSEQDKEGEITNGTNKRIGELFVALMISNRDDLSKFLCILSASLGINAFIVGHSHYRSGDVEGNGRLMTICSSDKRSPEAGHYMENEFRWERLTGKGLKEGRKGRTEAYYAVFHDEMVTRIDREANLRLVDPATVI